MASIFTGDGGILSEGLPGARVNDVAIDAAVAWAEERGESVFLADDDGEWEVYPDGRPARQIGHPEAECCANCGKHWTQEAWEAAGCHCC